MKLKKIYVGMIAGLSALSCVQGFAAGFQVNELSPSIQATAMADAATDVGDISGMGFNPATLGTVDGTQMFVGASYIIPTIGYDHATSSSSTGAPAGTINNEGNIAPSVVVPDFYFGTSLNAKTKVGVAVTSPWGLETNYDGNWVGKYNALDSKIRTLDLAPTISYNVSNALTLGAAFHAQHLDVRYTNDTYMGTLGNNLNYSSLTGSSWGYGYSLGLIYKPTSTTVLGASYRSRIEQDVSGDALTISTNPESLLNADLIASAVLYMPAVVNLGLSQQLNNFWTIMLGAQWTQWDVMKDINANIQVPNSLSSFGFGEDHTALNWKNSWMYSLGAKFQATDRLALLGGVAYDETPTIDATRDPRIPDSIREWASFGMSYEATKQLALDLVYTHIFMHDQSVNVTQTPFAGHSSYTVAADYSGHADIIGAGVKYTF